MDRGMDRAAYLLRKNRFIRTSAAVSEKREFRNISLTENGSLEVEYVFGYRVSRSGTIPLF